MEQLIEGNSRIWFDGSLLKENATDCFNIEYWKKMKAVTGFATGRGKTWFVQTTTLPAALRHYFRGGFISKALKDSYFFTGWENTRSWQEFTLLLYLREKGLAVPRPIAARAIKRGCCYQADLLVEKIDNAKDLVKVLTDEALTPLQYRAVGQLIRQLHDTGVCHSDLNIHNILLDEQGKYWLIDFDKCGLKKGNSWKKDNLNRLLRSFQKEKLKCGISWQQSDWRELLRGYQLIKS